MEINEKEKRLFQGWTTYEKVVSLDYMHHRYYLEIVLGELIGRDHPVAILDLGCGDVQPMKSLLTKIPVSGYVGIDESGTAITRAKSLLSDSGVPFRLLETGMQAGASALAEPFDLIVAGYSLHHLTQDEKVDMLQLCRRLLAPGGRLAIIDVFLAEHESRDEFLDRWEAHARQRFTALSKQELGELIGHVRAGDRPETVDFYRAGLETAGFDDISVFSRGAERLNKLMLIKA